MNPGLKMKPRWSEKRPPPLFVSVNMNPPDGPKTLRIAFGFVLVASIFRRPAFQVAVLIFTVSAGGGVPGFTVSVVVRVTPNHVAVIVTAVVVATGEVATGNVPLDWPPPTTVPPRA